MVRNIVVFGYNFPHEKTSRGLLMLVAKGVSIDMVVLQDRKELRIPRSKPIGPNRIDTIEPMSVCEALGLEYCNMDHDDYDEEFRVGVILGARILAPELVYRASVGILNVHPGLLPWLRNRDTIKWAIKYQMPQCVTVHWIDEGVDLGRILFIEADRSIDENTDLSAVVVQNMDLQLEALTDFVAYGEWEVGREVDDILYEAGVHMGDTEQALRDMYMVTYPEYLDVALEGDFMLYTESYKEILKRWEQVVDIR